MSDVLGPTLHYPDDVCLIELFDQQVAATPDREALIAARPEGGADRLTYRALAEREAAVSADLLGLGVSPGTPVIGRLQRGAQAVVALLAALRTRAAYVPLDAESPQHIVNTVLADTGASVVLSGSDPAPEKVTGATPQPLPGIALLMYTSGTTGRPKAVMHGESQLRNRMHWMWREYPWQPGEVACQRSPLGVMPSMWEFLGGLLRGVPTVIAPAAMVKDTRLFLRALSEHRVSRVTVTPSLLRLMLDDEAEMRPSRRHLRTVIIGGEHFSLDLVRRFQAALPDTMLINDYGCTEVNTILHTAWSPAAVRPAELGHMPGSVPIANLRVRLLDEHLRPVPEGTVGELCVEGRALARGYLKRDSDTAERFIDHPGGERCYRTGDLARKLADGTVLLLGRTDNQIKVNGMRIEPEGVEAVLAEHPAVCEAVITVRELASGARQLHARLVAGKNASIDLPSVRDLVADRLPSYARPVSYEVVTELPRNARGKVDRHALIAGDGGEMVVLPTVEGGPGSLRALTDEVRELLARTVLEVSPARVDDDRDFHLLGLDSVLSVQFVRRLRNCYDVELDVASLYDRPNLTALCAHLWQQLSQPTTPYPTNHVPVPLPRRPASPDERPDIAVIGYSGRFPQARDVEALWDLIVSGGEAVDIVPSSRWDAERFYDPDPRANDKSISKWGAFLENADGFEPLFFGIAPAEAKLMDPQQRLCLQEGWRALEHAGYCPDQLGDHSVGVFVGAKKGDYVNHLPREAGREHGALLLGSDPALIASRLAYHFDLHGPCLTVDTACSSSLTALHLARQSLLNRECDIALVGGVCVVTDPHFYVSTSKLGIFSPTGRTRPFDNDADGFVQGEGVVFVVLRRLADAISDTDTIHGVVRASALNQDGKTNGIGAPSSTAQRQLEEEIYRRHEINPAAIGYIEAHGTGTKIGDPIEIAALTTAFRRFTAERQFCALGSLKANIGHLTAAAGLAGLVKLLLCFRHATVPPLANFRNANEHLDFSDSPFYVPSRAQPWPRPVAGPRMAAISSFGLGGTNAHCVLAESPAVSSAPPLRPRYLIVLSARTEESLRQQVLAYLGWLRAPDRDAVSAVRDISFTLLTGRRQFAARHVLVAGDTAELTDALEDCLRSGDQGDRAGAELTTLEQELGRFLVAKLGNPDCAEADYAANLNALAELVCRGFQPQPSVLFRAEQARRIPLPTYPFLMERYWHPGGPESEINGHRQTRPAPASLAGRTDQAVTEVVAELLGLPADGLDSQAELADYGMDSIKAVTLKHRLEQLLGLAVPMESIGLSRTMDELVTALATQRPRERNLDPVPPAERLVGGAPEGPLLLALSADDEVGLRRRGQEIRDSAGMRGSSLTRLCPEQAGDGTHRLAVVAASTKDLVSRLDAYLAGKAPREVHTGVLEGHRPRLAYLCTGQGAQYAGMGKQLYETYPVFRETLDTCAGVLGEYLDQPLLSVMFDDSGPSPLLDETAYTQPALFALEYALYQLWKSWGVTPDLLIGHSLGELTAACISGVLDLDTALGLVARRAQLIQSQPAVGMMAVIGAPQDTVTGYLDRPEVVVAAVNAPAQTVISGAKDVVLEVLDRLQTDGITGRPLRVSHAFHSPLMDPAARQLREALSEMRFGRPQIPIVSNLTGEVLSADDAGSPEHWVQHMCQPVRFLDGMRTLGKLGADVFLEIGPSAPLTSLGRACLGADQRSWLPSLLEGKDDRLTMLDTRARLFIAGCTDTAAVRHRSGQAEGNERFPLTGAQAAYFVGKQAGVHGDRTGCHTYLEIEVGDLDLDRLRAGLQAVVEHHPALHTVITREGRQQELAEIPRIEITVHDRPGTSGTAAHLRSIRERLSHRIYPPGAWPLFEVQVTRFPAGPALLHISMDSSVMDGRSAEIFYDQWARCYRDPGTRLDPVPATVRDYVFASKRFEQTDDYRTHYAYWLDKLRAADLRTAPLTIRGATQGKPAVRRRIHGRLDRHTWQALRRWARQQQVSPTTVALTAFASTLATRFGHARLPVTLTHSTRLPIHPDVNDVVGPLTATSVFVWEAAAASFSDAVRMTQHQLWTNLDHSVVSASDVLPALSAAHGHAVSLPIVFTSRLTDPDRPAKSWLDAVTYAVSQTPGVALECQVNERDGELTMCWDVVDETFLDSTAEDLLEECMRALRQPIPISEPPPITGLQQGYLAGRLSRSEPCSNVYQEFDLAEVTTGRFAYACRRLLQLHPVLGHRIHPNGQWEQVAELDALPGTVIDLTSVPDQDSVLRSLAQDMIWQEFPPAQWPHCELRLSILGERVRLHVCLDMLVADGYSVVLIWHDLLTLCLGGEIDRVPAELTAGAREDADLDRLAAAEYWRRKLPQLPPCPVFPTGGASGHVRARQVGTVTEWARLVARAAELSISADAVLAAAFHRALQVCAQTDSFTVAVAVVDRPASERCLAGDRTVLCWTHHDPAVAGIVETARLLDEQLSADLRHSGQLSGIDGIRLLSTENPGWRPPLYRTALTSCHGTAQLRPPQGAHRGDGISITPGVDLDCFVFEQGPELHCHWDYREDAVAGDAVRRMTERFDAELTAFAAEDQVSIGDDRKADASLRHTVIHRWNDTAADYDQQRCLHELFAEQAHLEPDRIAVVGAGSQLSYGELDSAANQLAEHLFERGVRTGTLVGVCMERTPQVIVAIMAILKAGGGYVPLSLTEPAQRRALILRSARLRVVLVDHAGADRFDSYDGEVITVSRHAFDRYAGQRPPDCDVSSTDPAYAIFTSGSTGTPKGVLVSHRPVNNLIEWLTASFGVGPADRLLCVSPLTFDLSVYDIFGLLAVGGSLRLADERERQDPLLLARILREERVTVWNSAPAVLQSVLPLLGTDRPVSTGLRLMLLSGDWISLTLPDSARSAFPEAQVISLGGATEATVWSNYFPVQAVDPGWRSIPYGRPIQNATYYVLDDDHDICGMGVPGELFIGGECLCTGYLNDPERTAERFIPDPFSGTGKLYRTGDLACFWVDGTIELLGRIDDQVKIRGYRIELGEVEHALRTAGVSDAVAVVRGDTAENRALVAFGTGGDVNEATALARVAELVPEYMVPASLTAIDAFPLTSNGKVDRAALRDRALPDLIVRRATKPQPAPPGVEVRSAVEEYVRVCLTELLEDDPGNDAAVLNVKEPFGQLGLTSLHFAIFAGKLLEERGLEISPTLFYRYTTIETLCDHLAGSHPAAFAAGVEQVPAPAPMSGTSEQPAPDAADGALIAVVGLAGRLPDAVDLTQFWRNLLAGHDGVAEVPPRRWDWRAYYGDPTTDPGKTFANRVGVIPDLECFDAEFFGISPREAELMDPRQRLLMETVWSAVEHSGHRVAEFEGQQIGVFIGATGDDFTRLSLAGTTAPDAYTLTGISPSLLANRISYHFNWHGPSEVVDTACSSSLIAVHRAVSALRHGECQMAVAAAANTILEPTTQIALSRVGMLSPEGRCATFDSSANGYARGEGVGAVVLKPLRDALAAHDTVYGVIRASAVNHGGRANSLTAPNPVAQNQVLLAAHRQAGGDPRAVGYIETHGTGTELGDPIEFGALVEAFTTLAAENGVELSPGQIRLGAVKTSVGHLESAAGMAGLLTVLLALRKRTIPPMLHQRQLNPHITLANTPFAIEADSAPWRSPTGADGTPLPRRGAVSSFGFGGANAHLVIDEYPQDRPTDRPEDHAEVILLSARSEAALRCYAKRLADYLDEVAPPLFDVAYTLRVGRDAMGHRLAFVVNDLAHAVYLLRSFGDGAHNADGDGSEHAGPWYVDTRQPRGEPAHGAGLAGLARSWAEGGDVQWQVRPDEPSTRRIELPTYPFARIHVPFGYDRPDRSGVTNAGCSRLTGDEFYLADHVVQGRSLLAGAAYLELVKAAAAQAGYPIRGLSGLVWLSPVEGGAGTIELSTSFTGTEFVVSSDHGGHHRTHARGAVITASGDGPERLDWNGIRERIAQTVRSVRGRASCYRRLTELGLDYGPGLRSIAEVSFGDGEATAVLTVPPEARDARLELNPAVVDGALQVALLLDRESDPHARLAVPYGVDEIRFEGPLPPRCHVHVRQRRNSERRSGPTQCDVDIAGPDGTVLMTLRGITARPMSTAATEPPLLFGLEWVDHPVVTATRTGTVVVSGSAELAAALHQHGITVREISLAGLGSPDVVSDLLHSGVDALVLVTPEHGPPSTDHLTRLRELISPRLAAMRALASVTLREPLCLLHVNCTSDVSAAAIGAVQRCLGQEVPAVSVSALHIAPPVDGIGWRQAAELVACVLRPGHGGEFRAVMAPSPRLLKRTLRQVAAPHGSAPKLRNGGVYVVTGGLGRIGLSVAGHLAAGLGARIVLTGRSPDGPAAQAAIETVRQRGGEAIYVSADVSDRAELRSMLDQARSRFKVINGVFHAAGVSDGSLLFRTLWDEFEAALRGKVVGAVLLDEQTAQDDLDCFVLFSSLVGTTGGVGASAYSYANRFLDEFAVARQGRGAPGRTVSIGWAPWRDGGMRMPADAQSTLTRQAGVVPMTTESALSALDTVLAGQWTHVVVAHGRAEAVGDYLNSPAPAERPPASPLPSALPENSIVDYLRAVVAEETHHPVETVHADVPFEDYGIDSLLVMAITRRLEERFGDLPKTLLFENQNIADLAAHLDHIDPKPSSATRVSAAPIHEPVGEGSPSAGVIVEETVPTNLANTQEPNNDIAIIGMAGRFPGAGSIPELWRNLVAGHDSIIEIPADRWDHNAYPGVMKWGGFLDDVDKFDPLYFNISNREADWLDPQERLFLQTVSHTLEDAGYARKDLAQQQVGVYVGLMWAQYQLYGADDAEAGSSYGSIANRVSYFFDFSGPSIALDTMCSSSLTTIHLACESLKSGEIDIAVAGGVNVNVHPNKHLFLSTRGFAAKDGRCRSFGEGGTGYVPGEGVAALLLKPLARALRDGDRVHAVIKATAINHDGKTNGFTVPNPKAQQRLIAAALRKAAVHPRTISYLEAHGTGTALGDPIEVAGLTNAFAAQTSDTGFCPIGSVKSNIGHLEGAAGVAGIIKVILQMQQRRLVPSLHAQTLNPNIDFTKTPFRPQRELAPWPRPQIELDGQQQSVPRRAGVSSFGAGGANAHVVLQESGASGPRGDGDEGPFLISLSATDSARLKEYALLLLKHLRAEDAPVPHVDTVDEPEYTSIDRIRQDIADVLNTPVRFVDADDDFEDYGLTTRQRAKLADQLSIRFEVRITAEDLSGFGTPAKVAAHLDRNGGSKGAALEDYSGSSLAEIAYTLHTGREQLGQRLALLVSSVEDLTGKLAEFLAGRTTENIFLGAAPASTRRGAEIAAPDAAFLENLLRNRRLRKLAKLWCDGLDIDFRRLYEVGAHRRVTLPHYPFARERCWVAGHKMPTFGVAEQRAITAVPEPAEDPLARYFYRPQWAEWTPEELPADLDPQYRSLVIYRPSGERYAQAILDRLPRKRGLRMVLGDETRLVSRECWEVDVDDPDAIGACLAHVPDLGAVYFLGALECSPVDVADERALVDSHRGASRSLLRLARALDGHGLLSERELNLTVLTSNVRQVLDRERVQPLGADTAGLARAIDKEYPRLRTSIVDIDTVGGRLPERTWLDMIVRGTGAEFAVRGSSAYRRKLVPITLPEPQHSPFREGGGFVIIGGAGNVGSKLSHFLVEQVGANIVWIGRRAQNADIERQLQEMGPAISYLSADVTDYDRLGKAMREAEVRLGRIDGVFHSAMDFQFCRVRDVQEQDFTRAVAAKAFGTHALWRVLKEISTERLVLFSSGESFTGNPGWGAYGAACDLQDALGCYLAQGETGFRTSVVNWGFWEGNDRGDPDVLRSKGIRPLRQAEGMRALARVLAGDVHQAMVLDVDDPVLELMGVDLGSSRPTTIVPASPGSESPTVPLTAVAGDQRTVEELATPLADYLAQMIAEVLHIDEAKLDRDTDLAQYGVDSMLVISLQKELEDRLGKLPVTLLIEHPSVRELGTFLLERHQDVVRAVLPVETPNTGSAAPVPSVLRVVPRDGIEEFLRSYGHRYQQGTLVTEAVPENGLRGDELVHALVTTAQGKRVEVLSAGSGTPILFLPAVAQTAPVWLNQFLDRPEGYRTLVIHPPGYGLSETVSECTTTAVGEIIVEVLGALGIEGPVHLVASCFGGMAAQYIAKEYPDLVASFTLCGGFFEDVGFLDSLPEDMTTEQLFQITAEAGKALQKDFDRLIEVSGDIGQHYQRCADLLFSSQCANPMIGLRYLTELWTLSTKEWLTQIGAPTLCVVGALDTVVDPDVSRVISESIPNARLLVVDDAGHYPFLTHGTLFTQEMLAHIESASGSRGS